MSPSQSLRRTPSRRVRIVAAIVTALASAAAWAAASSGASNDALLTMLGFDAVVAAAGESTIQSSPELAGLPSGKQACLKSGMGQAMHAFMAEQMGRTVQSEENAQAVLAFSATPGGTKFVGFLREGLMAMAQGKPAPGAERLAELLSPDELVAVGAFLQTPAGMTFERLGGIKVPDGQADAWAAQIMVQCKVPRTAPAAKGG